MLLDLGFEYDSNSLDDVNLDDDMSMTSKSFCVSKFKSKGIEVVNWLKPSIIYHPTNGLAWVQISAEQLIPNFPPRPA